MAHQVTMDAMIKREDFAREVSGQAPPEIIRELNVSLLLPNAFVRRLLRKPEFQRETNYWTPEQIAHFIKSFADGAVIPSIILWRSTNFIFVIDGAHRLSALCAWISNDYGDREISSSFYKGEISIEQRKIAQRTRTLIDKTVGNFETLSSLVGTASQGAAGERATAVASRPMFVQQVVGTPKTAEDSFFAINTQGTPLDDTEKYLIRNRDTPVAIGARAIVRSGSGHSYWSTFSQENQREIIALSGDLFRILFQPEATNPLRSIDLPLGGSASPVDALALLIDFLTVVNSPDINKLREPKDFGSDADGQKTISVLREGIKVARRITGNSGESLGLHPAVYFTNDKGKHSRFLFLGMSAVISEKLKNNNSEWFSKFTHCRKSIETFMIEHKSLIGIILQNLPKNQRVPKMRELFNYLTRSFSVEDTIAPEMVTEHLGLKAKVYDITANKTSSKFTDETKSQIFYTNAIRHAQTCPICRGLLDVSKSVSFDHIQRKREGGLGTAENGQMVHPFCNTAVKG